MYAVKYEHITSDSDFEWNMIVTEYDLLTLLIILSFKNVFIMPNITPITDGSLTACIPLNLSGAASYCHNHNKERFLYYRFK